MQRQKNAPFLWFEVRAEVAVNSYVSLLNNSSINYIERYNPGEEEPEGTVRHATFSLDGQEFIAMDSGREHPFAFTEAISLFVNCSTQEEVDELWEKFTEEGEEGQCGRLKDKYGVSWQIVPTVLMEMLNDPDPEKSKRVTEAMLKMKKIDIETLRQAYEQQ